MFRTVPLSITRSFSLYTQQWYMSYSFSWFQTFSVFCMLYSFILGNSPASEFYMPTFRNTLFHLNRRICVEWLNLRIVNVANGRTFGSKIAWVNSKGGWRSRDWSGYRAGSEGVTTHIEAAGGYVKEIWLVSGWAMGWQVSSSLLKQDTWIGSSGKLWPWNEPT